MKKLHIISIMTSFILLGGALLFPAPHAHAAKEEISTYSNQDDISDENQAGEDLTEESESEAADEFIQERAELKEYLDQIFTIEPYESKAFDSLRSMDSEATSANRKSLFLKFTNTVIPNYTKFVSKAKLIKSNNPEIKKIHASFIKGTYMQLEGYILYQQAVSKNKVNYTILQKGNAKIQAAGIITNQVTESLYAYAVKIGYE
ncbi:hypothetical protein HUB98_21775 [Paenibacillus barcinonensis]|uniref:Uncharacterized protein n=1 Tax=Paenibacillus barcinonensis TaxID=198119 RepID=A0A2V4VEV7_PAEBA|nr:hypothetical protein [Paenibacillus barcinonensis]PYE47246.1 hypothetical protein DFQ00_11595 [Paenibacillus barcinonensis]QKS58597.1 hypothetical protein HUB98_21775 [Paenibacillus barcinonensis]